MEDYPSLESLLAHQALIQSGPFLSGIVHDSNNAVGAVIAYGELIGMGSHSKTELDDMLEDQLSAAKRIANLNDALSTLTRQEPPKKTYAFIGKMVEQLVLICEYRYRTRGVRLDVSLAGELDRSVSCYKYELARAALYVLLNALENSGDAPRKEVEFAATVDADGVTFRIRDRGPAIDAAQFQRALEPFVTTKPAPHLGLGLTAAKAAIDLHDGELSYAPETGVTLRIPQPAD